MLSLRRLKKGGGTKLRLWVKPGLQTNWEERRGTKAMRPRHCPFLEAGKGVEDPLTWHGGKLDRRKKNRMSIEGKKGGNPWFS